MLKKRFNSFKFAFTGLFDLFRSQPNARIHLCFAVLACCLGFFLSINSFEWLCIIFCIGLVLSAEAFNTALEYLTDLVSPDYHPLAGKAKDAAAAGVLLVAIMAALVGAVIFLPKLYLLFG